MGCWPHRSVCLPHGYAKGVADGLAARRFVISHETRQDRETGGVSGGPSIGTSIVSRQVEDRAGVGRPVSSRFVPLRGVELEEQGAIAIDDEEMTIAARAAAWRSAFDEIGLPLRIVRD